MQCPPSLAWVTDAGGVGGFAAGGLIAVGERDLEVMVERAWQRYVRPVPSNLIELYRLRYPGAHLITRHGLWTAFLRFLLAHELGHARQEESAVSMTPAEREAGADRFTGWLAERLGWDARIDRIIAHSIGCLSAYCTHPHPVERVALYDDGRRLRRRQELVA